MRVFKEEQRFNQLWIILLLGIGMLVPLGLILGAYLKNQSSFTPIELVVTISIIVLASCIIFFFKLYTRIDEHGIHYKFFPFHLKYRSIAWNAIDEAYVRTYDALNEYGGWGFKGGALWKKSKGTAINVSGDKGIQLRLKNGKKLLIGTQKENDAKSILATYKTKIKAQDHG
ncbi:hypothetical protein [Winogradskyella alexanderae]|uniref:PH domain-containing protein n=1 Tax=Winogradskyella alexanderae TaxID=2877123 RepID=A0ABS7XPY2_9FLAO|nr:hypothetical protein [Winogradskyella alexanderae]MCA0132073.1 hypothetical protein [Winogradskyella alexanderae]